MPSRACEGFFRSFSSASSMESFFSAASRGDAAVVAGLLDEDPSLLEAKDVLGCTSLMRAAGSGRLGVVEVLVRRGAKLNERCDPVLETALYKSVSGGFYKVVSFLLENGADASLRDIGGTTCLMEAARKGFIKIAQTLLRYDGDVDAVAESSGRTALWWACCWGNANVVRLLIEHGADHSRSDARGMRPLDVALRRPLRRRDLCVRLLEEADRSFMLWKARTLHDWEATKACAGSACLPAAAHPLPLAGVLAAAGSSRVAAMPTVRIQTETKQEDSQPAASPAMPAAAAAACGAAGAAAASISSETGEGSVAAESGEALVTDVARFVVQQLNGDLFREMMDIFFRTCSLPQEVGNKEGGLVR